MVAKKKAKESKKGKKEEYKRLNWDYCECGCKGYSVSFGTEHYWLFWDIRGGDKYHLRKGHGFALSSPIGVYDSFDDADRAVREQVKPVLDAQRAELDRAQTALS